MCRGCKAHQAHIESLEKQLDFFRQQLQPRPVYSEVPTGYMAPDAPSHASLIEDLPWVSEEEEELMAMRQSGLIDAEDLSSALAKVGALSTEISFSS